MAATGLYLQFGSSLELDRNFEDIFDQDCCATVIDNAFVVVVAVVVLVNNNMDNYQQRIDVITVVEACQFLVLSICSSGACAGDSFVPSFESQPGRF
jgi:hypothetical protein